MIKIERKIPMPSRRGARNSYPWADMKVGDSFFLADKSIRGSLYVTAGRHGYKIAVRNDGEGIRIWRTA